MTTATEPKSEPQTKEAVHRFSVEAKHLAAAWKTARPLAKRSDVKPILGRIHVTERDRMLSLDATNLESWIRVACEADGEVDGVDFCLEADHVGRILDKSAGERFEFEIEGATVSIRSARSRWNLESATGFPSPVWADAATTQTYPGDMLRSAIASALPMCDTASSRYAFGGLCFTPDGWMFGSDGCHATCRRLEVPIEMDGPAIVPHPACRHLATLGGAEYEIGFSHSAVLATCGNAKFTSALLEGRYPVNALMELITRSRDETIVTVEAAQFRAALAEVALATDVDDTAVEFSPGDGTLEMRARGRGRCEVRIDATMDRPFRTVMFGVNRLSKATQHIGDGPLPISIPNQYGAAIFSPGPTFVYFIQELGNGDE